MSVWGHEDDDLASVDALAPSWDDDAEAGDEEHDADFELDGDGIPDPTLTVRVWVDADRRLQRCRVSNKWRKRAAKSSLATLFNDAFAMANARIAQPPVVAYPVVATPAPLDWGIVSALATQALSNTSAEEAALAEGPAVPDRLEPDETEGENPNRTVKVTLGPHGQSVGIWFDEEWLKTVGVDDLVDAVHDAHRDAFAKYRPPVVKPGTMTQLVDANTALALEADAYLRRDVSPEEMR